MLLHRVRGLWNTYHGILAVILTVVFWIYLVITGAVSNGVSGGAQRFILYNLVGVLGLVIAAVRGRSAAATLLAAGFGESHTLALRQSVNVGIAMLIIVLPLACLVVKIFQAIQSPGPLFYRQTRSGVSHPGVG